jgi:N-acylneuraminate cytidylyltransferase
MKIIGSVIARIGSKRLTYKNLLPILGKPLIGIAIEKLLSVQRVDEVVVSTENELIARVACDYGAKVLFRPDSLAGDQVPSIPVFQHIVQHFPCDVHVNYNCNFPICPTEVIERGIEYAIEKGESLSVPYAVWAQTNDCLTNYGDPFNITAYQYKDERVHETDIHTMEDLLEVYKLIQDGREPFHVK